MFRGSALLIAVVMSPVSGCALAPAESAPPEASPEPMARPASLTEQPGDSKAVPREVVRLVPLPEGEVQPMLYATEIRNRCAAAVEFHVGPADAVPAADVVSNALAPGEAIVVGMASDEWVHLKGVQLKASAAGGWIVVTGEDETCSGISGVER